MNRVRRATGQQVQHPISDSYAVGTPAEGSMIHQLASSRNSDTKELFSDIPVAAHAATMILGGYETTGSTLSFVLHLLAKHPAA